MDNSFCIRGGGLVLQCCDEANGGVYHLSALTWLFIVVCKDLGLVFILILFLFSNCFQNLQTTVTSLVGVPDSYKTWMPSSGSQALTSSLASFLISRLAPLLVAVAAVESSLELTDAKLACSDSAFLLAMPLLLDLDQ